LKSVRTVVKDTRGRETRGKIINGKFVPISDSKEEYTRIPEPGRESRPGRRVLGAWWIEDFTEGVVTKLPLMNYPNVCRKIGSRAFAPSLIKKVEDSIAKSK